jgi:hypothetical protein
MLLSADAVVTWWETRIDGAVLICSHQFNDVKPFLIDMTETRQNKASVAKLKTTENVLAFGPQIQVIHRKNFYYINA